MNTGHSAAWDQDWQKAAGYYSAALDEFPENPLALSSLGLAYFELHDYENSLICYQHAAGIAPKDPVPQEKLARIYERMGMLKEATDSYLKSAELHLNARDVEKAIDSWQRVLAIIPDHLPTRQRMAAVYERTGRRAEAVTEYIATASILQRNGDLTRSMKTVEYATRLMPESQDARFALHTLRSNQMLPRPGKPKNIQLQTPVKTGETTKEGTGPEGDLSTKQNDPIEEARQRAVIQLAGLLFDQIDDPSVDKTSRRGLSMITRGVSDQGKSSSSKTSITLHLGQAIDSLSGGDENQAAVELGKSPRSGITPTLRLFSPRPSHTQSGF